MSVAGLSGLAGSWVHGPDASFREPWRVRKALGILPRRSRDAMNQEGGARFGELGSEMDRSTTTSLYLATTKDLGHSFEFRRHPRHLETGRFGVGSNGPHLHRVHRGPRVRHIQ